MVPELSGNFLSFLVVQRSVGCETQSVTSLDSRCVGDEAVRD